MRLAPNWFNSQYESFLISSWRGGDLFWEMRWICIFSIIAFGRGLFRVSRLSWWWRRKGGRGEMLFLFSWRFGFPWTGLEFWVWAEKERNLPNSSCQSNKHNKLKFSAFRQSASASISQFQLRHLFQLFHQCLKTPAIITATSERLDLPPSPDAHGAYDQFQDRWQVRQLTLIRLTD